MDLIKKSIEHIKPAKRVQPIRGGGTPPRRLKKADVAQMNAAKWRQELGRNIRGMRESLNLSQLQLASRLCWPVGTLAALERGELTPSEGQEQDIARWVQSAGVKGR